MKKYLSTAFFLIVSICYSQSTNQSELSLDEIMKGEQFVGVSPTNIFWSEDSQSIYFKWNPELEPITSLYKYDLATEEIEKVTPEEEKNLSNARDYDYNADKSKKVYTKHGDIYMYNRDTNTSKLIVSTFNEAEYNVSFSSDGSNVIFERDDNLFKFSLDDSSLTQLTNFKSGSKPSEKTSTEENKWLEEQQLELFEVLRDRKERKDLTEAHDELLKSETPSEIYINGSYLTNLTLGVNESYATYKLTDYPSNKRGMVPHFVNESGYTSEQRVYTKVGGEQASRELWMLGIAKDTTIQFKTDVLTGIFKKPAYYQDYPDTFSMDDYEAPKPVNFFKPKNSPDGKSMVIEIRAIDNKDRWFAKLNFETNELEELNHQHDDAWIAGPGIPWQQSGGDWGWIDNETIWFHSEKTGFSHLYTVNVNSKKEKALTSGNWEVHKAQLSTDATHMFITTNEIHPGERQFYSLNLKNLKKTKLTSLTGNNEVTISPNEDYFAIRYSYSNKPWELLLLKNEEDADEKTITESTTDAFDSYSWRVPENITFTAEDGVNVNARLYLPEDGAEGKPTVVFVHGAGYLQNAHKWWSGYYREYMFHNFLTDNGFVVLDVDYRASKGYGRDFRTGIYRHMGGKDMSDQVDGVKHLIEKYGVDKDRVGIYGGSYGGFITIMGMFNYPEVFKSGAAIRSVTDWAHYHHGYTANILNTPVSDPIAYQRSSPINFAEGLEGHLLMLHGMVDDNVHFQDVVRLSQRLIELKKKNWDNAIYPVERHGFIEASSWTDEYKRIYKLFDETLK